MRELLILLINRNGNKNEVKMQLNPLQQEKEYVQKKKILMNRG